MLHEECPRYSLEQLEFGQMGGAWPPGADISSTLFQPINFVEV